MQFHVVLQCIASVKAFWAEVTGEWHLAAMNEIMFLEMMLHPESLGTYGAGKGSGRILCWRVDAWVEQGRVG